MKSIYIFILLICFASPLFTNAQSIYMIGNLNDLTDLHNFSKVLSHKELSESDILGSPYENKEFTSGYLITIDNKKYENVPLRFNVYNDNFEYQLKNGDILELSNKEIINQLVIDDSKYKFLPYLQGKKTYKSFFKVIEEGNATLLVKQNIIFKEAQPAAAYKDPVPPKFEKKLDEYYIKVGDGLAQKVFKKNDLTEILSPSVENYIKKNKTKVTRLDDLQKLVQYYNNN